LVGVEENHVEEVEMVGGDSLGEAMLEAPHGM
jgi:hypothetical protein